MKNHVYLCLSVALAWSLSLASAASAPPAEDLLDEPPPQPHPTEQVGEAALASTAPIALIEPLQSICYCESGLNHFMPDGVTVKRNPANPDVVGICQVSLRWHSARATQMGLDLLTEAGNIEYSTWLYLNSGENQWAASRHCWDTLQT